MVQAAASISRSHRIPITRPAAGPVASSSRLSYGRRQPVGVAGIKTRAATRGDGEVIELDHGITVYPPKDKGGRWRAVWHEDGER